MENCDLVRPNMLSLWRLRFAKPWPPTTSPALAVVCIWELIMPDRLCIMQEQRTNEAACIGSSAGVMHEVRVDMTADRQRRKF
jgi:hypothetical protein